MRITVVLCGSRSPPPPLGGANMSVALHEVLSPIPFRSCKCLHAPPGDPPRCLIPGSEGRGTPPFGGGPGERARRRLQPDVPARPRRLAQAVANHGVDVPIVEVGPPRCPRR